MTVVVTALEIQKQSFGRLDDIRDAMGMWFSEIDATGDASAGQVQIDMTFDLASLYSLEWAGGQCDNAGAGELQTGWFPSLPVLKGGGRLTCSAGAPAVDLTGTGTVYPPLYSTRLPLSMNHPAVGAALLRCEFETNINGASYTLQAWGYYWDIGAQFASGGPRRPF